MSQELRFDNQSGQNVTLSRNRKEAKWEPVHSGGWVYSAYAMEPGIAVSLVLEGSGHCVVGVTKMNPETKTNETKMLKMKKMNDIRLHKRACNISLILHQNTKEVISTFNDSHLTKSAGKEARVWVAVYVQFGAVSLALTKKGNKELLVPFSRFHGPNIRLIDNNNKAVTVDSNPAAICFVPIHSREIIQMRCAPITEGKHVPSRYHVHIKVTDKSPNDLKCTYPSMLDPSLQKGSSPKFISLELLEKEQCQGNITVTLKEDNSIEYTTSSGKTNQQKLTRSISSPTFLVLELYRVSVSLVKKETMTYYIGPQGLNEVDSRVRNPSNTRAENSIDTFQAPCPSDYQTLNYVSLTEVKKVVSSQFNNPTKDACTTITDADQIWQRINRMEQKQEEMFQLLEESVSRSVAASSPLYPTCSPGQEGALCPTMRQNWVNLINVMRVDVLCDHLYQEGLIDEHDMHRIQSLSKDNQRDANRALLLILQKKRVKKATLSKILDDAQESHLKSLFFPEDF